MLTWGQFHRAAKQKKVLTRRFDLADFIGYHPNFHTKCKQVGWSVLHCLIAMIFASPNVPQDLKARYEMLKHVEHLAKQTVAMAL